MIVFALSFFNGLRKYAVKIVILYYMYRIIHYHKRLFTIRLHDI